MEQRHDLAGIEAFVHLSDAQLSDIESQLQLLTINGGETLISQGKVSDALFLVVSGRFQVTIADQQGPVVEIGPGKSIGEIGFFSGSARTATVTAARDSLVLRLLREDFDALCRRSPEIWPTIVSMLSRRLVLLATAKPKVEKSTPRTIAVCHAGSEPVPETVLKALERVFSEACKCRFVSAATIRDEFPTDDLPEDNAVTRWLNDEEAKYDYLLFLTDPEPTEWSAKAVRQADLVLRIGLHYSRDTEAPKPLNPIEQLAEEIHDPESQRLVLVHDNDGDITGTRRWLDGRSVAMHHHVTAGSIADYQRLFRFINGDAVGLVACGGGAYCAAHIGLFQAFLDAGLEFDMMGGTSGGAAMVGAFAKGVGPEELDRRTHDIFVTNRSLRRMTWPRYSLLDHKIFDKCLAHHYTEVRIEDLRIPYFAISTDLSHNRMRCHQRGRLWKAIRASSAIPGLLPPLYTSDGDILVDGSLLDNVPVRQMLKLKTGPNVVINFEPPEIKVSGIDYGSLPSRRQLVQSKLLPFLSPSLPQAPGPGNIITRSLAVNRTDFRQFMTSDDLLFEPPIPPDISIMDWQHHSRLKDLAQKYGKAEIARLSAIGHKLLR